MIDIWQNRAVGGVHLSHNPLTIRRLRRTGARRLELAQALAVGSLRAPDAAPLIIVLEPGELAGIHGSQLGPPEFTVGRRTWLAIGRWGWRRRGRIGLLLLLP